MTFCQMFYFTLLLCLCCKGSMYVSVGGVTNKFWAVGKTLLCPGERLGIKCRLGIKRVCWDRGGDQGRLQDPDCYCCCITTPASYGQKYRAAPAVAKTQKGSCSRAPSKSASLTPLPLLPTSQLHYWFRSSLSLFTSFMLLMPGMCYAQGKYFPCQ